MSKKVIIALLAMILIWGGFMLYRQHKLEHEQRARSEREFERLLAAAKRSPLTGLTHMGRALNRYYKVNNEYPPKLMDLYPNFIPSERFLTELDWEYERMERDFYLSKFVVVGGQPMISYVDSELLPDIDSGATMASAEERKERLRLAAAKSKRRRMQTVRGRREEGKGDGKGETPLEEEEDYGDELASLDEITTTPLADDFQAYPSATAPNPSATGQWVLPEGGRGLEFKRGDPDDAPLEDDADDVSDSISKISENVLVWKYKDGVHGFGNIQYPEAGRISIAVQGKWRYLNWPTPDAKADDDGAGPGEKPSEKEGSTRAGKSRPSKP